MRFERTETLPASPAQVWRALTEPDGLTAWFGAEARLDRGSGPLARGVRVEFRFGDGSIRAAVVEEAEACRSLVLRWLPFDRAADGTPRRTTATRIELSLSERDGGTVLEVVESPLAENATLAEALR